MQTYFKRNKYKNNPMSYKGSWYQSTKEGRHAMLLDTLKRATTPAQRVTKWEKQVKVPLMVNGSTIGNYFVDFHVWFADGHEEWHEVKGLWTDIARWKVKHFNLQYPDRLLLII